MSRNAVARGRRSQAETWLAQGDRDQNCEPWEDPAETLREENARLREQVAEVEGWYRLLQAEHTRLQDHEQRNSRRITQLQSDVNRLEVENHDLRVDVERSAENTPRTPATREDFSMSRIGNLLRTVQQHKWTTAAVVTIATLLARDATVQSMFARAADRARQAVSRDREGSGAREDSGFLRYAAMVNSRDQVERARKAYNEGEGQLKGDALLEAQDRLRAAKARYREARLAFLPELAKSCEQAKVPLPREAAEALTALRGESQD